MNNNKRIGIVTLYDFNYGSALQAYATQCLLESIGYETFVLKESQFSNKLISYGKRILGLGILAAKSPLNIKNIFEILCSTSFGNLKLTKESIREIHSFSETYINKLTASYANLIDMAKRDEYAFFLSGSDQIWNGAAIDNLNLRFLRFAPKEKRIAWSPSFGGSIIAKYNKKVYKKYISEYAHLSAREESGSNLIKSMTGMDAEVLCDPVILLEAKEWREKYRSFVKGEKNKDYVLSFFIDEPSDKAINFLKKIERCNNLEIVSFGYTHNKLNKINVRHCDGNPFDFLNYIDSAQIIITDSFHAIVFSVIFHKNFYAFNRQYHHNQNQSVRLTDFLRAISLEDRFEPDELKPEISFSNIESYIQNKKVKALKYLCNAFGCISSFVLCSNIRKPYISRSFCCGCGACEDVCPAGAIKMVTDSYDGHYYPEIDTEKCISCNLCHKVCQFYHEKNRKDYQKNAYVAAGKDLSLISHSASGGMFAVLAESMLKENAVVYGASLQFEDGKIYVKHINIKNIEDLHKLQGSKYVQSNTSGIFKEIKNYLKDGKLVLFSGTSCQIAAVKSFLGKDYQNFLTIDLICHGVPSLKLLRDYISYYEKKYKEKVVDILFRRRDMGEPYTFTFTFTSREKITTSLRNSAFYRIFMSHLGYRYSCYHCKYASIDKPSDITLGDFYMTEDQLNKVGVSRKDFESKYLSCVIVHTPNGKKLLDKVLSGCVLSRVPLEFAVKAHENLQHPSVPMNRELWEIYKRKGFGAVQKKIKIRNIILWVPKEFKHFKENIVRKIRI